MKFPLNKKSAKKPNGSENHAASESPMDVNLLERLVKLMSANDLNTVDVRDGDKRVILKRGAPAPIMAPSYASQAPAPSAGPPSLPGGANAVHSPAAAVHPHVATLRDRYR